MAKQLNFFDFLKNSSKYFFQAQLFAVTHFYLFFLSILSVIIKLLIFSNPEPIEICFWGVFSIFALTFGEISLRFKNEVKLNKFINFVISIYIVAGLPIGVFMTGSITSPSSLYIIVGLTIVALLTTGKVKTFLNIYIIGFCFYYIFIEYKYPTVFNIKIPTYQENFISWAFSFIIGILFFIKLYSTISNITNTDRNTIVEQKNELYIMSITDYLTEIYNKKYLYEILEQLIIDLNHKGESFILIAIDIDHFKLYNDTYGHLQGDICLKEVSTILKNSFEDNKGYAFRFGGEEFVIALKTEDFNDGINSLKYINDNLKSKAIINANSPTDEFITLSTGIILAQKEDRIYDVNYLLHLLDDALYKAKENGRNQSWASNGNDFWKIQF
ncbi:MAG: GGDEF domain-containing protein [Pleomorphochaeta sp.]